METATNAAEKVQPTVDSAFGFLNGNEKSHGFLVSLFGPKLQDFHVYHPKYGVSILTFCLNQLFDTPS